MYSSHGCYNSNSKMGRKKGRRRQNACKNKTEKEIVENCDQEQQQLQPQVIVSTQNDQHQHFPVRKSVKNQSNSMECLSDSLIVEIFRRTNGETIANLRLVCRQFNRIVMQNKTTTTTASLPKLEIWDVTLSARKLVTLDSSTDCLVLSYDRRRKGEKMKNNNNNNNNNNKDQWTRFSKYLSTTPHANDIAFQYERRRLCPDTDLVSNLWNFELRGFLLLDKLYFDETLLTSLTGLNIHVRELKIVYSQFYEAPVELMIRFLEWTRPRHFLMLNCDYQPSFLSDRLFKTMSRSEKLAVVPRARLYCGAVTDRTLYYLSAAADQMAHSVDFGWQFSTNITEKGVSQFLRNWLEMKKSCSIEQVKNSIIYHLGVIRSTRMKLTNAVEQLQASVTLQWTDTAPLACTLQARRQYANFHTTLIVHLSLR